ncbi:protein shisa-5 [Austrofundulus limnaeus]|uniref:Protein shisa-5 n=1 Tax=Austrofundulus limnaeus TaxID=52670 RepID=A0A2I4AVN2_AUSLI|nr:PREDICTED: protein shisa-5-like [Austrofundulus limnaeus]
MVSRVRSSILCVFCLLLIQAVWADICTGYWGQNGIFYNDQQCSKYCCGNCNYKVCCSNKNLRLTEEAQRQCPSNRPFDIGLIVGITCAVVIPVMLGVTLIVCCVSPHCLIYKCCRKRHNQRQTSVTNTTVNTPQSPHSPSGHQPTYAGYQSVPGHEGMPSAPPPSYLEITAPASFPQGHPLHPLSQPESPPPYSEEIDQPPYNPSYASQP